MFVRDCMTPDPRTIEPDTGLHDALGLMHALKIRHLPVMEGTRLVGIVTLTDLLGALPAARTPGKGRRASSARARSRPARVRDVMTKTPLTVPPDAPVEAAARLLRERKIGSLPVVEHQALVGIVTESDLFDALIHLLGGDIRGVRLSVDLPAGLPDLARFVRTVADLDTENGAVTVTARFDEVSRRGYLRLSTASPLVLAEKLATAGFAISNLRFESPGKPARAHSLRR